MADISSVPEVIINAVSSHSFFALAMHISPIGTIDCLVFHTGDGITHCIESKLCIDPDDAVDIGPLQM